MMEANNQVVEAVESSLLGLGNPNQTEATSVDEAYDNLLELKRHLQQVREQRLKLSNQTNEDNEAINSIKSHQHQVEQDIINAKMQVSELLSLKDSIARDVARAKRELGKIEKPLEEVPQPGNTANIAIGANLDEDEKDEVHKELEASTSFDDVMKKDIIEEEDLEKLQDALAAEIKKLRTSEERLIEVVDEISSIQKRKAQLKKMHEDAQDNW